MDSRETVAGSSLIAKELGRLIEAHKMRASSASSRRLVSYLEEYGDEILAALRTAGTGRAEAEEKASRKGLALAYDLIREKYGVWSPETGVTWPPEVAPAIDALCLLIDGDGFLRTDARALSPQPEGGARA